MGTRREEFRAARRLAVSTCQGNVRVLPRVRHLRRELRPPRLSTQVQPGGSGSRLRVSGPWVVKMTHLGGTGSAVDQAFNELAAMDRLVQREARTGKYGVFGAVLFIFTRACFRERPCALPLATFARQLGEDLARLHAAGVYHLDVKAANVVVCAPCEVRLVDFGLSCVWEAGGPGEYEDAGTRSHMPAGLCAAVRAGRIGLRQAYAHRDVFAAFVTVALRHDPQGRSAFERLRDGVRYRGGAAAATWPAGVAAFFERGGYETDPRALGRAVG